MFISKKSYLSLVDTITLLEKRLLDLENMHARIVPTPPGLFTDNYIHDGKRGKYCGRQLTATEIKTRHEHPLIKERTAWTRLIPNVTHEELAQFVIDGTPIKREQEIPHAKITFSPAHYAGVQASLNIKTPKGEINV